MLDVTKNAPQMAIDQLGQAFKNFFAKLVRYPAFQRKGEHDRFSLANDQFVVEESASASRSWAGCACCSMARQ